MNYHIETVTPIYTGGNIYVFFGSLSDGTYFIADSGNFDVTILDSDPSAADEEKVFSIEWQEEHLIRYIEESESYSFIDSICSWVLKNKPDGNYIDYDMQQIRNYLKG